MNDLIYSIILGLIQGFTEFFPISSSGHLILVPWLFNLKEHSVTLDIALHVATLFAILIYFRKDWLAMFKERALLWYITIATIPGGLAGLFFSKYIENSFRNPLYVALALGFFGLILYFADIVGRKNKDLKQMTLYIAIIIGIAQALAVMPGVSRSGITMTAALILGLKREDSVKFSFLLSAPIIFAAGVFGLKDVALSKLLQIDFIAAFLTAFFSSLFAINFMLKYVRQKPFAIFAVYRVAFSALIIAVILTRGL